MSTAALELLGMRRRTIAMHRDTARAFRATMRRWSARIGCALLAVVVGFVLVAPMVSSHSPTAEDGVQLAGPTRSHWLGTDQLGRDLLVRLAAGGRRSLLGAVGTLAVAAAIGLVIGVGSSMLGRLGDRSVMRLIDALNGLPPLVIPIALVGVLGASYANLLVSLVVAYAPSYARIGRTYAEGVRTRLDVVSARLLGIGRLRITLTHVLPAVVRQMLVITTLDVGSVVIALSGLSFIGLGAQAPTPEWGVLLEDGQKFFTVAPWLLIAPAVAISLVIIGSNLFGEALRDGLAEVEGR